MSLTIAQELKQTFHLVVLRMESEDLLTGRQWEKRHGLVKRCDQARKKETGLFNERFDARIVIEQKRLIDNAAAKIKQHKPVWGHDDLFDKTAVLAQADKNVRSAHENRITRINQYETRGLEALVQSARRENQIQGKPTHAFNKVKDRRQGNERRIRNTRKQQR